VSEVITGSCVQCGSPAERDLDGARSPIRERLASLPLLCGGCTARAERDRLDAEAERERLEREARREARRRKSGIPAALLGLVWDDIDTAGREDVIDVLIGGHALVLDDLDKSRPSEYAAEQLFAAIDTRLTEGVQLLVTTNLGTRELQTKWPEPYGDAITSRLASGEAYSVGGHDRRLTPRGGTGAG
jgi:hypothetical protein